jgi:hypothetical protein
MRDWTTGVAASWLTWHYAPRVVCSGFRKVAEARSLEMVCGMAISRPTSIQAEYFQTHIAPRLGPFVVLLSQDGADQADDGVATGKDADHVGPSLISMFSRGLVGAAPLRAAVIIAVPALAEPSSGVSGLVMGAYHASGK